MKTFFIIFQATATILALVFVLRLYLRVKQFKKQQQKILSRLEKGQPFWRINIARPEFMTRLVRLFPYEASGILVDDGDSFKILGFWQKGSKTVESRLLKSELTVAWLGNTSMRSGNVYWAQLKTPRGSLLISADTGMNALKSREALEDLFRGAFPDVELSDNETADFALEKNLRTRVAMMIFFALAAFALLDTFVFSRFELTDHQLLQFLVNPLAIAVLMVIPAGGLYALYRWLINGDVPARESWTLSSFLVLTCLLAAAPAAKRLDQALAQTPSQDYSYRIAGSRLEPQDPSLQLPRLNFQKSREYWAQFENGSTYKVPFLRGPLGLWQLDHEKFDKPLLDFYEARGR